MTPGQTDQVLRFEPAGSLWWRAFVFGLHVLGISGFLLVELPLWVRLPGVILILLSLSWEVRHQAPLLRGRGVRAVVLDAGDHWILEMDHGPVPARLLPSSRFWSRAVLLRFGTGEGGRAWVLLPADAVPDEDFRRLQARLRFAADRGSGAPPEAQDGRGA